MLHEFLFALLVSFVMAHFVPSLLIRRLQRMELPRPDDEGDDNNDNERRADDLPASPANKTPANNDRYNPTPIDIAVTRIMLARSKRLPPDIVDAIFDFAEYWAHSTNAINFTTEHQDYLRISGSSQVETKFLVSAAALMFEHGSAGLTYDVTAPLVSLGSHRHRWRQEPRRGARIRYQRVEAATARQGT